MKKTGFLMASLAASLMATSALAGEVTVKIGVLSDLSGLYADVSGEGSVTAAHLAVEDFDAAAKGMKVEIVSADHQNKPDVASTIARQWYDQDGVDVIVDVPTSSAALAINEITRERNKVMMVSSAGVSDLTGKACTPNTVHWTYDTWSLGNGTGRATVRMGYDTWFFLTVDSAYGHTVERETTAVVEAAGGKVLGSVRHPFPGTDFSSFLLQAQASGAKVIGLANAGGDTVNSIKQAAEFGITQGGQALATMVTYVNDVHALGLEAAQGLVFTSAFYWDTNDGTRAVSARFEEKMGKKPSQAQAGVYASVLHYLKAVEATGSGDDGAAVVARMKEMPTDDPLFGKGEIRADGRKIHDLYLFKVKSPDQSTGPWDYYETLATIPAAEAFRPLSEGGCPLVR